MLPGPRRFCSFRRKREENLRRSNFRPSRRNEKVFEKKIRGWILVLLFFALLVSDQQVNPIGFESFETVTEQAQTCHKTNEKKKKSYNEKIDQLLFLTKLHQNLKN